MASSIHLLPPLLLSPRSRASPHLLTPPSSSLSLLRFPLSNKTSRSQIRLKIFDRGGLGLVHASKNGGEETLQNAPSSDDLAEAARGQSTTPERFRHLLKEAPDPPVRWPWAIAFIFLVYCWRTVLWELSNWKKLAMAVLSFSGYLLKLALALIYRFIGDPITGFIRSIEVILYFMRDTYSSIVAFAPVAELTRITLFTSTILAIAEAAVPDSVSDQPYLLTLAGVIGFGAVQGFVLEPTFWLFLIGIFCYSRFIKKRDTVSAAMPSAAALAAVGEPWVRAIAIASYLAIAIVQYSKSSKEAVNADGLVKHRRLPLPLLLVALTIGINVAAKWVRYRHLTWMIS